MTHSLPQTVSDVMTHKVVTIGPSDTIGQMEEGMTRFRFRHMPVVENGKLVGLVSHRDILHALSSFLSDTEELRNKLIRAQPAKRIMQTELITVGPDEPLSSAAVIMWDAKLGCLPVVNDDNELLGIITEADFIRIVANQLGGHIAPRPPSTFRT